MWKWREGTGDLVRVRHVEVTEAGRAGYVARCQTCGAATLVEAPTRSAAMNALAHIEGQGVRGPRAAASTMPHANVA